ncbi:MAG: alpha/beta fold hydrolase [Legionellaceae bacterium]|nr:alpha/beta fold hydrolase [Legionellaceae bacterium]
MSALIHITRAGNPDGTPLVFFHGYGFDHGIWLSLLPELEARADIYFVDLPGHGLSAELPWDIFKEELKRALPSKPCIFIGWSLGGLYAIRWATEEPQTVSRLVTIAALPRFTIAEEWAAIDPQVFHDFRSKLLEDKSKVITDFVRIQGSNLTYAPRTFPSLTILEEGLDALTTWDFRADMHRLTIPVHCMFGRLDRITPIQTMALMQEHYPHFEYLLFHKAGHIPFLSHTQDFLEKLLSWL